MKHMKCEPPPEEGNNKSNKATSRVAISWIICHLNGKSCLCYFLLLPLLLFSTSKFFHRCFQCLPTDFFMADLISSTIRNLVSTRLDSTRLEKKTKHENTLPLLICVCILMCNKIIRKFQGRKITSNYRRQKSTRKNYDGEEVEALDWVSVKQQFHVMHFIPI